MFSFNVPNLLGGLRTAGALLIGNSFIFLLVEDAPKGNWWRLFVAGGTLLVLTSIEPKKE
jgi:hypothetical protein